MPSSSFSPDFATSFGSGVITRNYWDQPGTNACFWNTPLGDGAIWGSPTDADTIDIRHGGFINYTENFGNTVWVSQNASNPTATFTGVNSGYDSPQADVPGGITITVTAHIVPGSYSAGPWIQGIDQPYVFVDTVGHPGMYYHFAPVVITSFAAGQGPYNTYFGGAEDATSDFFAVDQETGHGPVMNAAGLIRGYDVDPTKNPARMPGQPNVTAIQHVLMFSHQTIHLKANANPANSDFPNGPLLPNSWPAQYQDWQQDIGLYTGHYIYGTLCGIPINVPMPSGLTTAGQQLFWTLQHYGATPRVAGGSDFSPGADQDVPRAWIDDANKDLPRIVQFLCPLRNQHQGGQSFIDHPINGPGNRVDIGPPPLAGTASVTITPSPNNYVVSAGSSSVITDAFGNLWGISSSGVVTINGIADTTTSNVTKLAFVGGTVWQQNSAGLWWGKTSTLASWSPASGQSTSPLTGAPVTTSSGPQLIPAGYLSTSGSQFIDGRGRTVRIAGVYWPGGDSLGCAPLGLTSVPLTNMMTQIVNLGFNTIRLPWNDAGFFITGSTYIGTNTANPTLAGLTALQVMDAVIAAAKASKLKVILVHYNCEGGLNGQGGPQTNGLWFDAGPGSGTNGNGTVIQTVLQNHWVTFATRYLGNDTVIGFELHNAPSIDLSVSAGANISWGDGAASDIKAAWTTIGNAILAANPNLLIICPGPKHATALYSGSGIAPEGDLSLVATKPISLNVPGKVVYAVQEYPNAIVDVVNAYPDSGTTAVTRMSSAWGSVVKNNLAPVIVTEMGASLDGGSESAAAGVIAAEQAWASTLISFCNGSATGGPTFTASQQGVSTCWASWGDLTAKTPNGVLSGGFGGTVRAAQQQIYSQVQFTTPITTSPVPTVPVLTAGTASTVSVPLSWSSGPPGTASTDQSFILAGSGGSIIDSAANAWTINSAGQVSVNGAADTTTGSVIELAYVGGIVWQANTSNTWWGKTSPTAAWSPAAGQTTSPLTGGGTTYQVQYKISTAATWTNFGTASGALSAIVTGLVSGATYDFQVVASNSSGSSLSSIAIATTVTPGSPPPNTPPTAPTGLSATGVTGTGLNFSWSASTGSSPITYQPFYRLHPVTPPPPPVLVESTEGTIVLAGSTSSIIDKNLVRWTISASGQVTVNGTSDTTTSGVVELAYHTHQVYQKNSGGLWWFWSGTAWTTTTDPFAPPPPPPVLVESAEKTTVSAGSTSAIIDVNLVKWTISAGGQVTVNGTSDTSTANVVQLLYHNHQVYQKNSDGLFWFWSGSAWVSSADPFAVRGPGYFVQNGQFMGPNGLPFKPKGVNSGDEQIPYFTAAVAKRFFPGINIIRLPFASYRPVSYIQPFINDMTGNGITVLMEHHPWPPPYAFTGQELNDQMNWYRSIATAFGGNPLVWFGSQNEPGGGDISGQHLATYNTIRGTGSKNIIVFNFLGGGNPGTIGTNPQYGYTDPNTYTGMTNVGWDLHFYPYAQDGTMDENVIRANALGTGKANYGVRWAQTERSADGLMPVLFGEFGPQEDGGKPAYPNANQLIDAVCTSGYGFIAWCMTPGGSLGLMNSDPGHGGSYSLTGYGQQIAGYIASQ